MRPCDVEMVRNVANGGIHVMVAVGPMEFTLCSAAFAACTTVSALPPLEIACCLTLKK